MLRQFALQLRQLLPLELRIRIDRTHDRWRGIKKRNRTWFSPRLRRRRFDELIQKVPSWTVVALTVAVLSGLTLWIGNDKGLNSLKDILSILLDRADAIALVAGVMLYLREVPDRRQKKHLEAWKVIDSATGVSTSYARLQALEELVEDGVPLEGLDAFQADLRRARLPEEILIEADLRESNLAEADLRGANLKNALLQRANLNGANLYGADLEKTNLEGASLKKADLRDTFLKHAVFKNSYYDEQTQFPNFFKPDAAGMIFESTQESIV